MNTKINIKNILLCAVMYLSLGGILFLYWATGKSFLIFFIPAITSIIILVDYKNTRINKMTPILFLLITIVITINSFIPTPRNYIIDALIKGTIMPFFVGLYFLKLKEYPNIKKMIFNPLFIILNLYYIVNFFIMQKQILNHGFMVHNRSGNSLYMDMITGLVGENGTHKLTFLFITTLYLNYYYFDDHKKIRRRLAKVFFLFILISSIYISTFNGNRMYYFILLFSMTPILYITKKNSRIDKQKILKNSLKIIILITIVFSIYKNNYKVRDFINSNIIDTYINGTFSRFNESKVNDGNKGEERVELLKYAIKNTNLMFGKGIGSIHMTRDPSVPTHFGINDIIIRIYTGGIFFAILTLMIHINFYISLFDKKDKFMTVFIIIMTMLCAFYTQSYSQIDKTFPIGLSIFMIYSVYNKKIVLESSEKNENNRNSDINRK